MACCRFAPAGFNPRSGAWDTTAFIACGTLRLRRQHRKDVIPARVEQLTRAFYEWEIRGRGWEFVPYTTRLEPPFQPFRRHDVQPAVADDGRHHTWLSALLDRLTHKRAAPPPPDLPDTNLPDDTAPTLPEPCDEAPVLEEFLVTLPSDARVARTAILLWLQSFASASERAGFELSGSAERVEIRLALAPGDASHILAHLRAVVPEIAVVATTDVLPVRFAAVAGTRVAGMEIGLASEFMVPLAPPRTNEEPLLPLVAALAGVADGELGLVQVLFEACREPWAESVLRSVVTPHGEPFFADAPELTSLAREKVSSPLFAVVLRVAAVAADGDRAQELVRRIAGGLATFGNPLRNEFLPLPPSDAFQDDLVDRTTHRPGMLLCGEELAALLHLPGAGVRVPGLWRGGGKSKSAPQEALGDGTYVGRNEHAGIESEVRISEDARSKHVHVIGASGTGKSTLLVRMILEDIAAGCGVAVLDPHGDLVDEVAGRIPAERIADCVFFDPSDEEVAVGWNILRAHSEAEREILASDLVGVFRRLSTSWGDQMTAVLGNAILAFLESPRGGTLVDLRRFLIDADFRKSILATVADPYVASFWDVEFPRLIGRRPEAPILTRLDMFLRSKLVRRAVTATDRPLDFRALTDEGGIFLGKLAGGAIGEENAALLGALLVSKFHQVTLARALEDPAARRPFHLYADEFHLVATPSMASLFSGARKFRLGVTVAHQDLSQLHAMAPDVERALLANAYVRICFRLGDDDARAMAKGFSTFTAEDLMSLRTGHAICRVGGRDADFNLEADRLTAPPSEDAAERRREVRQGSRERFASAPPPPSKDTVPPTDDAEPTVQPPRDRTTTLPPPAEQSSEQSVSTAEPAINKATLDYLSLVARSPFLTVRERNATLNLSAWRGDRLKEAIIAAGLAEEVAINPGGRGERFKLLDLTERGRDLLVRYGVPLAAGHGRGGIAHQWWVQRIAEWLRLQGAETTVEDETKGVRVDIGLRDYGKDVAIEVETSDGHILENLRKDRAAGYVRTVCLVDSPGALTNLQAKLDLVPDDVVVGDLRDFEAVLTSVLSSLRPPNQNAERRRRRRQRDAPAPTDAVAAPPLFEPGAYSTPLAADYLGLSPATLETLRIRGGGPTFSKLGRRVVYAREDLDAWLAERRRRSTSDPG